MNLGLADDHTQLVFHVLAHVRRAGPADLYDRRHIDWATRELSRGAQAQLTSDGEGLARSPGNEELDGAADLHRSLAAFRRTAARPLAEVLPADVADPPRLRALQRLGPAAELLHASMGLLAREFAGVHARWIEPWGQAAIAAVEPWLATLAAIVPALADARVELVWPLGPRGRAMPARLLIGCVDPLRDPVTPAIVALHEHAVCTSGHVDYIPAEWDALVRVARWCGAAPPRLREAHARWLAGLELTALLARAADAGLLARAEAAALQTTPTTRAALLQAR